MLTLKSSLNLFRLSLVEMKLFVNICILIRSYSAKNYSQSMILNQSPIII